MTILNLTQHNPTPEQMEAGVVNLPDDQWNRVKELLTFEEIPDFDQMMSRAWEIAALAAGFFKKSGETEDILLGAAMIGGAPYFMPFLVNALMAFCIIPLFSFTKRVSVEEQQPDGTVVKKTVFRHEGWVDITGAFALQTQG
ncbi:hypothetical protein Rm378p002 [Rhodothermus phage RM378]|uniref:hypothetical protein n=1 Tax=Rhodothermus phage RM378 TaxID=148943 RepID=UPI000018F615|nr:hypothetical protein Rm378p002 [Rhodothermus phage RM378]